MDGPSTDVQARLPTGQNKRICEHQASVFSLLQRKLTAPRLGRNMSSRRAGQGASRRPTILPNFPYASRRTLNGSNQIKDPQISPMDADFWKFSNVDRFDRNGSRDERGKSAEICGSVSPHFLPAPAF
jgi:hypothetical protein